jgi:hypothetical protein
MISALIELMNTYYMSGDFTQLGTVAWTLFKSVPDDIPTTPARSSSSSTRPASAA